jgi:hypothetical protein
MLFLLRLHQELWWRRTEIDALFAEVLPVTRPQWGPSCVMMLADVPLNAHPMCASEHNSLGEEAIELANNWYSVMLATARTGIMNMVDAMQKVEVRACLEPHRRSFPHTWPPCDERP